MTTTYDLVAIGTGSAVSATAFRCGSAGRKVAVIDSGRSEALVPCADAIQKGFSGASEIIGWTQRMQGKVSMQRGQGSTGRN